MISIASIKKILLTILMAVLIVFVVIQFIQPARNISGQVLQSDISNTYNIPQNIHSLFIKLCYDCHSNNTNYPWYSYMQPIGWIIAKDIEEGKAKINFSEFGSLSSRRQKTKLQEIEYRIKDGTMPLPTYQFMHSDAKLTTENEQLLVDWIQKTKDGLN